jgi:hypothetical protein
MKPYLINKCIKLIGIAIFISNMQPAIGQSKIEYKSDSQNLNAYLEIPELQTSTKIMEISENIKLFFDYRVAEYERFLQDKPYSKLPVILNFSIDSLHLYEHYYSTQLKIRESW